MKAKLQCVVTIVAICAVVYLERLAILAGMDGVMLGVAVAAVAGLGGYEAKGLIDKLKTK